MNKKIILTGASGFVGKNLLKFFKKKKIDLIKVQSEKILKQNINFKNVSHILHVGFDMRKKNININKQLKIMKNICQIGLDNNIKVIFLSSSSYGKKNNRKIIIKSKYHEAKNICEKYLIQKSKNNLKYIILRVFNLYGPGQKKGYIISDALLRLRKNKNKKIEIKNNQNSRDFIFIDDLVSAIFNCIKYKVNNKILEVGSGKSYSVKFIYKKIADLLNKKQYFIYRKPFKSSPSTTKASINETKKTLKWAPMIDIRKGLEIVINKI